MKNRISEINRLVGKKLKETRVELGLTRIELAKQIYVSQQQILKYERGINQISIPRLYFISKALSKKMSFFLDDYENIIDTIDTFNIKQLCKLKNCLKSVECQCDDK